MRANLTRLLALLALPFASSTVAAPAVSDLSGAWETTAEFGKFKFQMIVRIAELAEGKIAAKVDIPDQGAKDIPINALLYNYPAVRWEIDQFGTAFNGQINESATEIAGAFDEGPGGRPVRLVFKRWIDKPEPIRRYTFVPGEAPDVRGYWLGYIEMQPGTTNRAGLKIGRLPDETFAATLDLLDQGAMNLPAAKVRWTDGTVKLEWQLLQVTFEGKLDQDGTRLAGDWKQRNRRTWVSWERLERPATVLPDNISFVANPGAPQDIRGFWEGTLQLPGQGGTPGNKLRVFLKLGQTPDGAFAGTLGSPDQGANEIPITSIGYTNPVVRVECKGIRGVFVGKLNAEGSVMDGSWEQGPTPLELKLTRTHPPAEPAKP